MSSRNETGEPLSPDVARPTRVRYCVLAWLCLAAAIAYICRGSISVAESTIRGDLGLTEQEMGGVLSAFFLTYALFQIPTGRLGELWGSRRALPLLSVVWSVATAAMAAGAPFLLVSRLVNGAAQAGLFPCALNTISRWIPTGGRALATGSLASFMGVGGALAVAVTGVVLERDILSWQALFAVYASLGLVWAVGFAVCFREFPTRHAGVNPAELELIRASCDKPVEKERPAATPWLALLSSRPMWCICGQQVFRAAAYIFFLSWFATYLQETRGVTVEKSGILSMIPQLSLVVGGLLGGSISDWVLAHTGSRKLARKGLATFSQLACAAFVFLAYFVDDPTLAVLTISTGCLCASLAGPCAYTTTIDMGGRHIPTVFATMNMCGNIGATVFPYVVPHFRAATSWESVLLLFGAMYVGAAICWMLLDSTGTVFDHARKKQR